MTASVPGKTFEVECALSYQLTGPTDFLFQIVRRAGLCRDFAHLGVTFCCALNIRARLAVGSARFDEPPHDFHVVFEVYLGGRSVRNDATRMSPLDELVRIALGRDAKDVPSPPSSARPR